MNHLKHLYKSPFEGSQAPNSLESSAANMPLNNLSNGVSPDTSEVCLYKAQTSSATQSNHQFSRKKIKSELKLSKSVIKRKFDKTYKYLSLQLDQDLGNIEENKRPPTSRKDDPSNVKS